MPQMLPKCAIFMYYTYHNALWSLLKNIPILCFTKITKSFTFQLWVENLQKNLIKYSGFVGVYQCADYLNAGGEALARCEV